MDTIKLKTHVGDDGILKIETYTNLSNTETEVIIIIQPIEKIDRLPDNFFDELDAIDADDISERPC